MQKKIDRAIRLIRSAAKIAAEHGQPLEIAYSGGKDSDVILELAKMAGVNYRAIYKNTTIDPPGTIKHVRDMGVEIVRPRKTFRQLVQEKGIPNRFSRFCCEVLKEYKILDYCVIGVRREESPKRAKRYREPEECRTYRKGEKVRQYYPILDWTSDEVATFIAQRGIKCAPVYYDEQGTFHAERRLGCMCCPLQGRRKRVEAFINNPGMVRLYIQAAQTFLDNHPASKSRKRFDNAYEWLVRDLFYDSQEKWEASHKGLFPPPPTAYKDFLENYFSIKL